MKYIIFISRMGEIPMIFPKTIVHIDVAKSMRNESGWQAVSAGFINFENCLTDDFKLYCYGDSFTLKLKSRGNQDTEIIKRHFQY